MKMTSLKVSTPEGYSGRIMASAADYIFRYHEDAFANTAISADARAAGTGTAESYLENLRPDHQEWPRRVSRLGDQ
jgi:hypothetical protein